MDLYDWLLFVHVLAAFMTVASVVVFAAIHFAAGDEGGPAARPLGSLNDLGERLWQFGGAGTLIFGIWLAIDVDEYQLWDAWILIAFVLWAVAGFAGTQVAIGLRRRFGGDTGGRPAVGTPTTMLVVMAVGVAALLVDMIYKPGA